MESIVQQSLVDKQCLEIAKKELLLENNRLLQQIMSQDVLLTVMNFMSLNGKSTNMERKRNESCDKCFNLDAELLKPQNTHIDLLKSYSQLEKHCISLELSIQLNQENFQTDESCDNQNAFEIPEYFENNDLKAQLQDKDTTIFEQAKEKETLDNDLDFACKHAQRIHELLVYVGDTCPNAIKLSAKKVAVTPKNNVKKVRIEVITSANVVPPKKTTSYSVETQKPELKVYNRKPKNVKNVGFSKKAKIVESKNANHSEPNNAWGSNAIDIPSSSFLVIFLRIKDEAPEAIIKCIKNIQVHLNATVRNVRTYNGTEFVNQTLREFYENDAPSTSIPSIQEQEHSPNISQGFEESPKTPIFCDDPLHEYLHEDSTSQGSSSNVRQTHTLFEHLGRWTKDHPIENVIDDPSRSVSTRKQLETNAMWCYFDAFLTFVEPKNFKQAMREPSWIDAMQEEIHEFERLEV
ncbi:hypothetical protein Tco_0918015 [Tanacetum coccineum]